MHYGRTQMPWEITDYDLEHYPVWVRTPAHTEPVMTPLYCEFWYGYMVDGIRRGCGKNSLPTTLGYFWKLYKGHGYLTRGIPLTEEIPQREAKYREKMAEIIEDPFGYADKLFVKFDELMAPFSKMNIEQLSREELIDHIHDIIDLHIKSIAHYFDGWFAITPLPGLFQQLAGDLAGLEPTDPLYSKLTISTGNPLYQSNSGIADLARLALDLKLDKYFKLSDKDVLKALEQDEVGKKWLNSMDKFLEINKWKLLRMYEFCEPGWYDKPALLVADIKRYMEVGGVHKIDEDRDKKKEERDSLTKEFLSKIPEAQRGLMEKLLVCSRAANYWSEGSAWHGEFKRMAFGRRCFIECGKRLVQDGAIEKVDDIFMLFTDEIISTLGNREKGRYIQLINERKKEWEGYKALTQKQDEIPSFLGDPNQIPEMLRLDPTLSVSISQPKENAEKVGALCVGGAGSPGIVEGVARVIWDETHFDEIKKGEIMVCPMTSATWTPLFGIIKALVCDSGGSLSHPVIVSREYGLPAVVGTGDATQKIQTGDKLRVDGDLLRVYKIS
ncbi:PEP-utilizing enzyme [Desulfobacula sp.]|uniref:PEP-utilizing enzyme n=1 Tax=Desulfobacula sp. TaxID=2593537 RepID=UPI00261BF28F|nr:PEP-utilizing enzyme [Desulfobacula sp.]